MSQTMHCPDCGHDNPAGSTSCEICNFPLVPEGMGAGAAASGTPAAQGAASASEPTRTAPLPPKPESPAAEGEESHEPITVPRMRPPRGRRVRRAGPEPQALSIWLMAAVVAVVVAIVIAIRGYKQTNPNSTNIDGASKQQLEAADQFRAILAKDSTDIQANIGLGNVLFDTGNWSEAIIHYRAAIARDSTRATTFVDLGVCYYNLGDTEEAEKLFQLGLDRDPKQPVALFNLGVVAERKGDNQTALKFFHEALDNNPPEGMNQAIAEAMKRVQSALGATPGKIPAGASKSGF